VVGVEGAVMAGVWKGKGGREKITVKCADFAFMALAADPVRML